MQPGKATESDILAWIEGELPADRSGAVEAAFAEDASLRAWAASMREDRAAMMAWSAHAEASAPMGLAESAIERVERDALLGPSEMEALAMAPRRESAGVIGRVRRYATAAAVLLLVGVIAVTGVRLGSDNGWVGGSPGRLLVDGAPERDLDRAPNETLSDPHADLLDAVSQAEGGALASAAPIAADETELAENIEADAAPELAIAMNESALTETMRIQPLAKESVLAELVESLLGEAVIAGEPMAAITPQQASEPGLRDLVVVRAWGPDPDAIVASMRSLAAERDSPAAGWHVVSGNPGEVAPVDGVVCTVSLPGEAAGFAWFTEALGRAGASRVELTLRDPEARDTGAGRAGKGVSNAAGALWWGDPIREWAGWTRVPVLIAPE